MQYALEKISTLQACDALLAAARKEKLELERKRRNLGDAISAFRARIDDIHKESLLVRSLLETFTAAYQASPEGRYKARMKVKVKRLEVRQALLEGEAYTCNAASLLAKEMKYYRLDSQVSAMEHYITAVQHRRTALTKAPLRASQASFVLRAPVSRQRPQPHNKTFLTSASLPAQDVVPGRLAPLVMPVFISRRPPPYWCKALSVSQRSG